MMSEKKGKRLPSPESGTFGAASMNSYMWGFWMGVAYFLITFLQADLREGGTGFFLAALGIHSTGWAKFWSVILYFVATAPVSRASLEYYRFTGRSFVEDRIGFAKAGGQDIGMFSGLVAVTFFVLIFAQIVPTFVKSWIRVPLLIVASIVCGNLLAGMLSRRAYTVLFGSPTHV